MPAKSGAQRRLMGLAEHHPEQVSKKNRGVLKMSGQQLHDFASTKGLKHDTAPPGGFAHMGTTVEGPDFRGAKRAAPTFTTGDREDEGAFDHAGTTREGPRWQGAAKTGPTVSTQPVAKQDAKAFANSGTTKATPYATKCATDAASSDQYPGGVSRIRLRAKTSREHSGGSADGFKTNTKPAREEKANAESHYDLQQAREQLAKGVGGYEGGRKSNWSPTAEIRGERQQQGPQHGPGRQGKPAFKMAGSPK